MRFPSRGIPFEDTNLLAVLRWILGQEEAVVLTLGDLPSLCVVPEGRCYYSEIDLKDLAAAVAAKPAPVIRVAPFGRFEEAQEASGTTTAPPRSLDHLFWVACVHSPVEEVEHNARLMHRLRRWPDLGQLPHRPEHLRWSGVLVRMPMTLAGLAASTGSRRQDASAFLDACAELRLLETRPATAAELATASVPDESTQTKQVRKRVSILRTILSKLGVRAS
jgi:hypothetical protein